MQRYPKREVLRVYERHPLRQETILQRVQAMRGTLVGLTEIDLAVDEATGLTDQNHVGGLKFVRELAHAAQIDSLSKVLDLGCGLGGSARALAWMFGCRVHGIDFSPRRCREAIRLTQLVGLTELVTFECGDLRSAHVPHSEFDVLWGQDAWVHMENKNELIRRWSRALKPGGRTALEDAFLNVKPLSGAHRALLAGLEAQWKAFLISVDQWHDVLCAEGFEIRLTQDLTAEMIDHFKKLVKVSRSGAAATEEVCAWKAAIRLGKMGLLGYGRFIAEKPPTPG